MENLLRATEKLGNIDPYRYDLVNVARQVLSNHAAKLYDDVVQAHELKSVDRFKSASERFLALIRDLDTLLATRPEFLLGRWLEDAKRWGTNESERARFEWNARRVLTLWGAGEADAFPRDYALKEWSGMLTGFYLGRWELFFQQLGDSLARNEPLDADSFNRQLLRWERDWASRRETYPTDPRGDSLVVARSLWEKYCTGLRPPKSH